MDTTRRESSPSSTTVAPSTSAVIVTLLETLSVDVTAYVPAATRISSALPPTCVARSAKLSTVTVLSARPRRRAAGGTSCPSAVLVPLRGGASPTACASEGACGSAVPRALGGGVGAERVAAGRATTGARVDSAAAVSRVGGVGSEAEGASGSGLEPHDADGLDEILGRSKISLDSLKLVP